MPFASINGANLYYEDVGTGTPIVFVHAGIADSRMWDSQFADLKDTYRLIRLDLRGYGQSAPTEGLYAHREDVLALMDHLALESVVLVGCSMSGRMALDLTLEQPQRVKALVLVAARPAGFTADVPPSPYLDAMIAADDAGDIERLNELEILQWVVGPRQREDVAPHVLALALDMNRIALHNEGHGEEKPDPEPPAVERLAQIAVPTLVVWGDADVPMIRLAAAHMMQHIPGARSLLLTNAGHLPNMERPAEFNAALGEFLNTVA